MKRAWTLTPLVFLLIIALTATPVLATKKNTEKIEYTLRVEIRDMDKRISGVASLTFSGRIEGTPDYEYEDSGVDSGEVYWEGYYEEYWVNETGVWKAEVYWSYEWRWTKSYNVYEARWYSPQRTYNGRLVAVWEDGSTTTFKVNLNPLRIGKSTGEGLSEGEETYSYRRLIYLWDEETGKWGFVEEETYEYSWTWSYTYRYSTLDLWFSGKIQSKGRPPLEGVLFLRDHKDIIDGWEYRSISAMGMFGPYSLSLPG